MISVNLDQNNGNKSNNFIIFSLVETRVRVPRILTKKRVHRWDDNPVLKKLILKKKEEKTNRRRKMEVKIYKQLTKNEINTEKTIICGKLEMKLMKSRSIKKKKIHDGPGQGNEERYLS